LFLNINDLKSNVVEVVPIVKTYFICCSNPNGKGFGSCEQWKRRKKKKAKRQKAGTHAAGEQTWQQRWRSPLSVTNSSDIPATPSPFSSLSRASLQLIPHLRIQLLNSLEDPSWSRYRTGFSNGASLLSQLLMLLVKISSPFSLTCLPSCSTSRRFLLPLETLGFADTGLSPILLNVVQLRDTIGRVELNVFCIELGLG